MVFLGQAIYSFEAQEVRNLMLQTVHKPELKWGRYGYLNQGCKKGIFFGINWVRANFLLVIWDHFLGHFLGSICEGNMVPHWLNMDESKC